MEKGQRQLRLSEPDRVGLVSTTHSPLPSIENPGLLFFGDGHSFEDGEKD